MSSLPLEVHEVLEEEYASMYGPPDALPSGSAYRDEDLIDKPWAHAILAACTIDAPCGITAALNGLMARTDLKILCNSPAMTENGRALISDYDYYTSDVTAHRRAEINRRIVDDAFAGAVKPLRDLRLANIYRQLHGRENENARTALCISGGGIRSATFALGVLQGLAGAGILDKFDYLSTVSGGGYIGSWLSSWVRRHPDGITGVQEDLVRADTAVQGHNPGQVEKTDLPVSKIDPEPRPLQYLREYSNYLSPKLGLLSADSWTMVSLYLRNLLLNLLILIPILAFFLAIPRGFSMLLRYDDPRFGRTFLLRAAVIALAAGFGYLGAARPTIHGRHAGLARARWLIRNSGFLVCCVAPLTIAATALALYWSKVAEAPFAPVWNSDRPYYVAAALAMSIFPALIYYIRFFVTTTPVERRESLSQGQQSFFKKFRTELQAAVIGLLAAMLLLYLLANKVFEHPVNAVPDLTSLAPFLRGLVSAVPVSEVYVCFAIPAVLLAFFVQNAVFVGLSGGVNQDYDREWWARGAAWVLMTAVFLALACFIAVFGPVLLYRAPVLVSSVGGISGILAGLIGFSAKTPANDAQKKDTSKTGAITTVALSFAVPLFVIVFLAAISLGTTMLIQLLRHESIPASKKWLEQFQSNATYTQTSDAVAGTKLEAKYETPKTPFLSIASVNGVEHLKTVHGTHLVELEWILAIAIAAVFLSRFINVNRFSMHGLYRNRLIRAYLGASRYTRDPDGFTGFDPHDNLQMYELRQELIWPNSFGDVAKFIDQLRTGMTVEGSVEKKIWSALDEKTQQRIAGGDPVDALLKKALIQNLNEILQTADLGGVKTDDGPAVRVSINRRKLQDTFTDSLRPLHGAPLHVINTALNLTTGANLAWQQRKAESFTISPLHSGSLYLGYRDSKRYGGPNGISLGTAVTISGAAASPNQGYHSSSALAFMLTVLNVRLGSWLGNPGLPGRHTYKNEQPRSTLEPLAREMTGSTNDQCPLVYLSDGGHFENLGIYEMVLRRCRYIVASDAGCDPKFTFEDLGNAIRKIRMDLGVPIDIQEMFMFPRTPGSAFREGRYVAIAKIRYSAIDENVKDDRDGTLVYVKPSVYSEDYFPKDVYNYAQSSDGFPHESTADQFFSESQFESYRALGRHVINEICGNYSAKSAPFANTYPCVSAFADAVRLRAARITQPKPESVIGDEIGKMRDAFNIAAAAATRATDSVMIAIRDK